MRVRLKDFRDRLGVTLDRMSERTGYSISQLSRWENGDSNIPSERLPLLARHYECRIADIFEEDASPFQALGPTLYVKGVVAAGVWREVWQLEEDQWETFTGRQDISAPLRDRFGLRIDGESMNDIYPSGSIVECVALLGGASLESGKRVVVQRQREDLEFEITVKEYLQDDLGREWLMPRSSKPEFQTPYLVGSQETGIVEVRVIAVVVASVRPE